MTLNITSTFQMMLQIMQMPLRLKVDLCLLRYLLMIEETGSRKTQIDTMTNQGLVQLEIPQLKAVVSIGIAVILRYQMAHPRSIMKDSQT